MRMIAPSQNTIDEEFYNATQERMARYTVGIAVANNQGVGTGTLIASGQEHSSFQHYPMRRRQLVSLCIKQNKMFTLNLSAGSVHMLGA